MEAYNIAIVGKSGVGKSSLINYLFNDNNASTGCGRPQTVKGFHLYKNKINNKNVNIFDSWGLEAGKTEEWLKEFDEFQRDKRMEEDVSKWIHTIIYCISGSSKRIEDYEINIIELIKKESLNPIVVITKSDSKDANSFANKVEKITGIKPVQVCNVEKEMFGGKVRQFGNSNLIDEIQKTAIFSFTERFNLLLEEKRKKGKTKLDELYIQTFGSELLRLSDDSHKVSKNDIVEIENILKKKLEDYKNDFKKEIDDFIYKAKLFYKNEVFPVFERGIVKDIDVPFNIQPDIDFTWFDFLVLIAFPFLGFRKIFKREPSDDQKVYPIKVVLKEFMKRNKQSYDEETLCELLPQPKAKKLQENPSPGSFPKA